MGRAVALLMLFLVVGSATGAFGAIAEAGAACEEDCGEGDEDCCPLVCPRCACVARSLAVDLPQVLAVPRTFVSWLANLGGEAVAPESVEPGEILHVPIVAASSFI